MNLIEFIDEKNIVLEIKAKNKPAVLEEMAENAAKNDPSIEKDELLRVLLERERLGSTGIGDGVAIPHGKLNSLKRPVLSFARSFEELDFDSMDGEPTHLFFLLIAPENSSGVHLQVLARLARILKNVSFRHKLMECSTRRELYQAIVEADEEI